MSQYYGDFSEDETVYIPFNTFDSNDPSASVTITNLADADIKVHKDGSVTQIVTDGATIAIDFDSITGNHLITIDTSAHADYATGSDYQVRIEGTTVDAATINAWVGSFSIENRHSAGALRPTTAGRTLDVASTGEAGIDWANVAGATTANAFTGTTVATVTTLTGHTAQTGDSFARIGAAGASLTDLGGMSTTMKGQVNTEADSAIETYKLDHLVLTADADDVADDSIIAKMVSSAATADWSAFVNTTDSLQAIRDRGDTAWTTGAGGNDRLLMADTTIATLATQTSFTLTAGSADDDAYNNLSIVIEDVSTSTQKAVGMILDYTGSSKTVTLKEALAFTIATTDKVYILAENSLKSTVANRQLDVTTTGAAGIDWGNVENKTTANDLTQTDIQLCDTVTTNTDMVGTDNAALASALATAQTDLDTLTGSDGATLATTQGNYAPAKAADNIGIDFSNVTGATTANAFTATTIATVTTNTDMRGTDSAALASVCTETRLAALTDWLDGGRLDLLLDAIPTTAMRGTDSAATAASLATAQLDLDTITGTDGVTLATAQALYAPNKVVPDAAGTAPTAVEIRQEIDSNSTQLTTVVTAVGTTIPNQIYSLGIKKNAAFSNFEFEMVLTGTTTPATGLTVTGERSIDGAAFGAVAGTIAEVSDGIYQFDALAADTNGDSITWKFSSLTADDTKVSFKTIS